MKNSVTGDLFVLHFQRHILCPYFYGVAKGHPWNNIPALLSSE